MVIDIGNGRFAYYAHLIPGSLRVAVGDQVSQGQVIGKLGNSGNSSAPHLHFHICNGRDYLFSEGLPYVFSTYVLQGTVNTTDVDAGKPWIPSDPEQTVTNELFMRNQVVILP